MVLSTKEAIARLNAIGISNLLDDSIWPRPPLCEDWPSKKIKLCHPDQPLLPLEAFDTPLILSLDELSREATELREVKQELLLEVHFRQNTPRHPFRYVRQVLPADVAKVIKLVRTSYGSMLGLKRPASVIEDDDEFDVKPLVKAESVAEPTAKSATIYYLTRTATSPGKDVSVPFKDFMKISQNLETASSDGTNRRITVKLLPVQSSDSATDRVGPKTKKLFKTLAVLQLRRADTKNTSKINEMLAPDKKEEREKSVLSSFSSTLERASKAMQDAAEDMANDRALAAAEQAIKNSADLRFVWERNIEARLAQTQFENVRALSGLELSPYMLELFKSMLR
ncbi:uncharacterized protein BKA78DRAFT_377806 [Phyllosticta capitalensis]|uniref:uncharacterized protein n=1 Tax=Phyllosticta capitalensis TaxID=121624 RepID=UPI003130B6EE